MRCGGAELRLFGRWAQRGRVALATCSSLGSNLDYSFQSSQTQDANNHIILRLVRSHLERTETSDVWAADAPSRGGNCALFFSYFIFLRGCKAFGVVAAMLQQNDMPQSVWTLLISECLRPVDGAQPRVVERAAACRPTAAARTWKQWYATEPQEHLLGRVTSGKSFCRSTVCESHCEGSASMTGAGGCLFDF